MSDGPTSRDRPPRFGTGTAVGMLLLVGALAGTGLPRPPLLGDGVWITPLRVMAGLVALVAVLAAALVLRAWPRGPNRVPDAPRRRWWVLVLMAAAVGTVVSLRGASGDLSGAATGGGFDLGPLGGGVPDAVGPLVASPTAVAGGLVFFGLLLMVGLLATRWRRGGPAREGSAPAQPVVGALAPTVSGGSPDEVIITAWATGRSAVVAWLGAGAHDPPGRLLRRTGGTAVAAPMGVLTRLYLPVRYGRFAATAIDADEARAALDSVLEQTTDEPRPSRRP